MCGIAGAVAVVPGLRPDPERVRRMLEAVRHRGPDGEGLWVSADGRAVLGHRRLSVIDLVGGAQPMTGGDNRSAITFNGEIYNYRELRGELVARGVPLRTQSDTEILLRLIECEGPAALERCVGMFAFAIWDGQAGTLLLGRDRVGKKPLYLAERDGILYFASNLAAVRAGLDVRLEIDLDAVDEFLSLGFIPAPRTIWRGVEKLPAATTLLYRDGRRHHECFWNPGDAAAAREAGGASLDELDEALHRAVALRLRSDVPLGVFLSGGIDSSLVTAYAARQVPGLRTFAIGFGEASHDETQFASAVSRHLGTEHQSFQIREELFDVLPDLVRHAGEPFADASALPLWVLARAARSEVTVALGGDGGDEGFAGYPWYRLHPWLERRRRFIPGIVAASLAGGLTRVPAHRWGLSALGRTGRALAVLAQPSAALRYAMLRVHVTASDVRDWYAGELRERHQASAQHRLARAFLAGGGDDLRRMRVADVVVHLADGLLVKSDLATMAHGLELRSPLLDHDVLARGLSLGTSALVDEDGGKLPLRTLLARSLPRHLVDRPKQGFVVPFALWFRQGLRQRITALPTSEALRDTGWFDHRGLSQLAHEHAAGVRLHTQRLFNLLVLEEWLRLQ